MVGANYMGGRRNAAKARTRDKSGKAQKEFFGRRRLNLLSKGLGVHPRFVPGEEVTKGAQASGTLVAWSSIDFNHAKKAESLLENNTYISESISSVSSTSEKRKWDNISSFTVSSSPPCSKGSIKTKSSSSFKPTKSKLLQQLDILEPLSSNTAISCIFAMPDLAGLSSLSSPRKRSCLRSLPLSPTASNDESRFSGGEDEIVDYFSGSGSECRTSSASASRGSVPLSRKRQFSILVPEQSQHSDDPTSFTSPVPSQQLGSHIDMVFPDDRSLGFENLADVGISRSTDWSFNDLSSSPASPVPGSPHRETNAGPSAKPSERLLADEGKVLIRQRSQDSLWLYAQKNRFTDVEMTAEQGRTNLLDYSDPWEQIGVILGLQKDCVTKDTQTPQSAQEENDSQELLAAFESDLPPSDIPLDDSLDDTVFAPSSLPIAESSEATKVSSIPDHDDDHACVFEEVEDIFEDIFDLIGEGGSGLDRLDEFCFGKPSDGILPLSDPVAILDVGTIKSLAMAGRATKAALTIMDPNVALRAHTSCDNGSRSLEKGLAQFSGDDEINSTPAPPVIEHNDETSTRSHTLSTPATVPSNDKQIELKQSPVDILWSGGDVALQEENIPHDMLRGGGYSIHIAEVIRQKRSALAVPELLECDGVYQGPCLLSDESEYSELEE